MPTSGQHLHASLILQDHIVLLNNRLGYLSVSSTNGTESIVQVTSNSQRERTIARIHSRYANHSDAPPTVVTLGGSLFYLDPPTSGSELRRVTPSKAPSCRRPVGQRQSPDVQHQTSGLPRLRC